MRPNLLGYSEAQVFARVVKERGKLPMDICGDMQSSNEFSRLIDGMREECVLQGIDVATPQEIAEMRWTAPTGE